MRVLNGGTAHRSASGPKRSVRGRAFFSRDQTPTPRSTDDDDSKRPYGLQAPAQGWLGAAPQVRVRQANDRAKQQLGELALLNETLMGQDSWRIRRKVEYLRSKRQAWEGVYNAACKQEVSLTVAHLEAAMAEVRTHEKRYFECNSYPALRASVPVSARTTSVQIESDTGTPIDCH